MRSAVTKVAIVVPTHWDFLMGGAQLQAKLLLEELISRPGVEVNYLASRVNTSAAAPREYALTQVSPPGLLHRYGLFWDYFSLQRHLKSYQPDLIYQRVATAYTGISARYAKRNNVPMMWHVANSTDCDTNRFDLGSLRRPHAYLENAFVGYGRENADQIIVQNQDQKTRLQTNFGTRNTNLIPNFHPIPEYPKKPVARPMRVLWIANLKTSKRPEAMVEVAKQLANSGDIKITMVGSPYPGSEQTKQDAIQRSIDALPNLDYRGALPLDDVNTLLAQSHLLVNTSIKEGFSNTFIQAWLRGVQVLTLGINPDNRLNGGPLGESFTSIADLANAITLRLEQPEKLAKDGTKARDIAKQDFSLENASKLADLLLSLRKKA